MRPQRHASCRHDSHRRLAEFLDHRSALSTTAGGCACLGCWASIKIGMSLLLHRIELPATSICYPVLGTYAMCRRRGGASTVRSIFQPVEPWTRSCWSLPALRLRRQLTSGLDGCEVNAVRDDEVRRISTA